MDGWVVFLIFLVALSAGLAYTAPGIPALTVRIAEATMYVSGAVLGLGLLGGIMAELWSS